MRALKTNNAIIKSSFESNYEINSFGEKGQAVLYSFVSFPSLPFNLFQCFHFFFLPILPIKKDRPYSFFSISSQARHFICIISSSFSFCFVSFRSSQRRLSLSSNTYATNCNLRRQSHTQSRYRWSHNDHLQATSNHWEYSQDISYSLSYSPLVSLSSYSWSTGILIINEEKTDNFDNFNSF